MLYIAGDSDSATPAIDHLPTLRDANGQSRSIQRAPIHAGVAAGAGRLSCDNSAVSTVSELMFHGVALCLRCSCGFNYIISK